ncbi:hypothetical protein [Candidatus Lokiarchaeum ossiferum]|uniref:hypothetical protein n=1 Tax=Candidatus Lokiarchaeum ossiferum TaxID=2951803 RepID=UPI00352E88EA
MLVTLYEGVKKLSHGKRYSAKERKEILHFLETHTYEETVKEFEVSQMTLARWVKRKKERETRFPTYSFPEAQVPEIQTFLKILELMDEINTVFLVSSTGQLLASPNSPPSIDQTRIVPLISKLLATIDVSSQDLLQVLDQEAFIPENIPLFSEILINTAFGVVFVVGLNTKVVIMIIFNKSCSTVDIFGKHHHYITRILTELRKVL